MRLRRVPALYWILALGLAACTSVTVFRLTAAADARARYWGTLAEVPVASRDVPAGSTLDGDDFELRRVPEALLPASGVVAEPAGLVAVVPLVRGEVLVEAKLAPTGLTGPAALLEPGERAVAVPRIETVPPVEVGDRVDVILTADPAASGVGGPPSVALARGARVVDVADEAVTLAVARADAPRVAFAAAQSAVALVISPPGEWEQAAGDEWPAAPADGPASAAGDGHPDHHGAGDDPVDHEGEEAAPADEAQ